MRLRMLILLIPWARSSIKPPNGPHQRGRERHWWIRARLASRPPLYAFVRPRCLETLQFFSYCGNCIFECAVIPGYKPEPILNSTTDHLLKVLLNSIVWIKNPEPFNPCCTFRAQSKQVSKKRVCFWKRVTYYKNILCWPIPQPPFSKHSPTLDGTLSCSMSAGLIQAEQLAACRSAYVARSSIPNPYKSLWGLTRD